MTSIHTIQTGDTVQGTYCGATFTGVVTSHRPHTMNYKIELFFVALTQPVTIFGEARTSLLISASDDAAAAARYNGGLADTLCLAEAVR